MKYPLLLITVLSQVGCASLNNRDRTLSMMAGGAASGFLIGAVTAPNNEKPVAHALLWGGILAATAGVVGLFINNSEQELEEKKRQISSMERELQVLRGEEIQGSNGESKIGESQSSLEKNLPTEYKKLVKPGKWTIYKVDQWVSGGENVVVHQDKMLKVEPPQININQNKGEL